MRMFQHVGQNRRIFHSLLHILHLFYNTCPYKTTPILFIRNSIIMINIIILRCFLGVKNIHRNQPSSPFNHLRMFLCYYMAYLDIGYFVNRKFWWEKKIFCPWRLTRKSFLDKAINNTHCLSSNRYRYIFPKIWHVIIIWTLTVSKICCIYHLNIRWKKINPVRKIHVVMRIKVNSNKLIFPDFSRDVFDGCINYHDELPMVYHSINIPPWKLQELPCLSLVLICLEFIIGLIESAFPSLLLPKSDPLLRNFFEAFSEISVRL